MSGRRVFMMTMQILFAILCVVFALTHLFDSIFTKRASNFPHSSFVMSEWTAQYEDGSEAKVFLPAKLDIKKGQTVSIKSHIPMNLRDGYIVAFYNSRDAKVYIGDELRLSFDSSSTGVIGGIVKGVWTFIVLEPADAGKEIRIVRDNPGTDNSVFKELYYGDSVGVMSNYINEHMTYYFFTFLLAVSSFLVILIGSSFHMLLRIRMIIVKMAIGTLMASLWLIFDSEMFQLIFDNYYIDGVLAYMGLLLMPLPIMMYFNDVMKRRHEKIFRVLMVVSVMLPIVMFALHLFGIANFEQNNLVISVVIIGILLTALIVIIMDAGKGHSGEYRVLKIGVVGVFVCTLLELILKSVIPAREENTMFLIAFYIILGTGFIEQIAEVEATDRARRQAIFANAQKSSFLANMSHEIRTPINSIIGMNEMILRENHEPEINDYATQIASSGRLLLGLVNDILDFSKIEAGKMEIIEGEIETSNLIRDLIAILSERTNAKKLVPEYEISESIPSVIIGDEVHIKQVVVNLISNATKYTEKGIVKLLVDSTLSAEDNTKHILRFRVKDTGIGIKQEHLDLLFDTFTRVDMKRNRSIEGTGLGLSIVKRLVDEMNGTIEVESSYGIGSCFTVTLPVGVAESKPVGSIVMKERPILGVRYKESFHAPNAHILVVDDNPVNIKVVLELLKHTGLKIDTASGGRQCVSRCAQRKYDLILMDHRMPDVDGVEALHLLRSDADGKNKDTDAVVLTANAFTGLREKYIAEGFRDYLSKPIDSALLEEILIRCLPPELVEKTTLTENDDKFDDAKQRNIDAGIEDNKNIINDRKEEKKMTFAEAMRAVPGMDYDATCEQYGGDDSFMQTLLETIVSDGYEKIKMMYDYLAQKDYKDFGIEAHAAKSNMATIGAMELSAHAKQHEFAAKEDNIEFIEQDAEVFLKEYETMLKTIEAAMNNCD